MYNFPQAEERERTWWGREGNVIFTWWWLPFFFHNSPNCIYMQQPWKKTAHRARIRSSWCNRSTNTRTTLPVVVVVVAPFFPHFSFTQNKYTSFFFFFLLIHHTHTQRERERRWSSTRFIMCVCLIFFPFTFFCLFPPSRKCCCCCLGSIFRLLRWSLLTLISFLRVCFSPGTVFFDADVTVAE